MQTNNPVTMRDIDKYASPVEKRLALSLVTRILKAGYLISVCDGEEWTVKASTSHREIAAALASTDSDTLRVRRADKSVVGSILLIWGNGEDLISDHHDLPELNALVSG